MRFSVPTFPVKLLVGLFFGVTILYAIETTFGTDDTPRPNTAAAPPHGTFRFHVLPDRRVELHDGERPVWRYNADFLPIGHVPEKDSRRFAGCYVHPLYGIDGEILTDDAPDDHYHHHGVFWTWPHVIVSRPDGTGEHYDSWTSDTRLKQLFLRFVDLDPREDRATFTVENGWFIAAKINEYPRDADGCPRAEKILDERVTITTRPVRDRDGLRSRAVDFDFLWTVGDFPVTLRGAEDKSYGGFSVRFRPSESKRGGDSRITVPDGPAADDLPETPLPWADYTSLFRRDASNRPVGPASGAAVFVPKTHPDFPPTWLTRYYGPLCVGWPGVKDRTFASGERIALSYRIWIHDRPVDAATVAKAYDEYAP